MSNVIEVKHPPERRIKLDGTMDAVKIQLLIHCYINKIELSHSEVDALTLLAVLESVSLNEFCSLLSKQEIFKTSQSARNGVGKLTEKGIIIKKRINKVYTLYMSPDLFLETAPALLLDYKFLAIDTQEG